MMKISKENLVSTDRIHANKGLSQNYYKNEPQKYPIFLVWTKKITPT